MADSLLMSECLPSEAGLCRSASCSAGSVAVEDRPGAAPAAIPGHPPGTESSVNAWTYINHRHPHASLDDGVVPIGSNVGHLRASANPEQLLAVAPRSRGEGHRPAAAGIEPVAARIEREVARSSTTGKVRPRKEPEHHSLYPHRPLHDLAPKPRQGRQTARVTCNSSSDFQGYGTRHA